jgi:thiol-disulfide isomerase/thioredoxin
MNRVSPGLLLAIIFLAASCKPADAPAPASPAVVAGAPATVPAAAEELAQDPKPELPSLVVDTFDGGKFDLAEHRGKWVVVNFWATWCNPCLKEIPELDAFDKSRDDVEVIGLAYEEIERADMLAFLKQHVISYPIAVVDVYAPPADFETPRGLPMTYLIAPDGRVARKFLGPVTPADLTAAMAANGKAAPAAS